MIEEELNPVFEEPFNEAIQRLEDLMSQSGRAFLLGAGCSKCAGLPLTAELTENALASAKLDDDSKKILGEIQRLFNGSSPAAHIEDFLSELVDLIAIANRRSTRNATANTVMLDGTCYTAEQLIEAAEQIKRAIADIINPWIQTPSA